MHILRQPNTFLAYRRRSLKTSGPKAARLERLIEASEYKGDASGAGAALAARRWGYWGLTADQLRADARVRGLALRGSKADLVGRAVGSGGAAYVGLTVPQLK